MPSKEEYKNDAKRAALAQSLATLATGAANENVARLGAGLQGQSSNMAQAAQQGIAEEEAKKKKKAGTLGKIGTLAGGLIAAPFTAGMSIPAMMAIGGGASALGGTLGEVAGGGKLNLGNALGYGATGAIGAGIGGGLGSLAKGATTAGTSTLGTVGTGLTAAGEKAAVTGVGSAVADTAGQAAGQAVKGSLGSTLMNNVIGNQIASGAMPATSYGGGNYGMGGGMPMLYGQQDPLNDPSTYDPRYPTSLIYRRGM